MNFVVEGKIKGKARPRWSSKSASMYTPLETKQYENYIAHCFRIAGGEKNRRSNSVKYYNVICNSKERKEIQ